MAAAAVASAAATLPPVPAVYPLRAGLIDIGVNLTDNMYKGFYNFSEKQSHDADLDCVVDRAAAMGVVGLIITGGNLEESQSAVDLAIAQNRRLRERCAASAAASDAASTAAGVASNESQKVAESGDVKGAEGGANNGAGPSPSPAPSSAPLKPLLKCYATVGCHPTRTVEMKDNQEAYIAGLRSIIAKHSVRNLSTTANSNTDSNNATTGAVVDADSCVVVAIGECGLDYDRLHFTDKEQQLIGFEAQFTLAKEFSLPMFLHDRNTGDDFREIMARHADTLAACGGGVVHSFTGDEAHLKALLDLGLYIGINGCSMKTSENLEVVKKIPLDRLMLETDGPWCEIKKTHASHAYLAQSPAERQMAAQFSICKKEKFTMGSLVKSRYEPVQMIEVLEVVFGLRKEEPEVAGDREQLAALVRRNTEKVFPLL